MKIDLTGLPHEAAEPVATELVGPIWKPISARRAAHSSSDSASTSSVPSAHDSHASAMRVRNSPAFDGGHSPNRRSDG
jgi:hypothetical protein